MEEQDVIRQVSLPIYESRSWMKFLGVVMIVQGVMTALTIVGIIFCWLPIWLGVLLFKSASAVETAYIGGSKVDLIMSMQRLKTYFVINGVLMLLTVLAVIFAFIVAGAGIIAALGEFNF